MKAKLEEERNEKKEAEREKLEAEELTFIEEVNSYDLSKSQIAILRCIDNCIKGNLLVRVKDSKPVTITAEKFFQQFDSGKMDSPVIRRRLQIIYEHLMASGSTEVLQIAANFAKKYNL
jgi:hypothetical protein